MAALPGSEFGADPGDLSLRLSTSCLHELAEAMTVEAEEASEVEGFSARRLSVGEVMPMKISGPDPMAGSLCVGVHSEDGSCTGMFVEW